MKFFTLKNEQIISTSAESGRKMNTLLFFTILFIFQLIFIFQGVDMADSGSYASFYQQIFKNPESAQYNFMFWLSGIIGGIYLKIFPGLGLWGLRLTGVITCTATIYIAYKLLKNFLNTGYLQLSLLILVLFMNNNPKEFYYNNLSSLIYILVAYFLFFGLHKNKPGLIFLSGAFVAANVFNRTPNILGIGIISGIIYHGYLQNTGLKKQIIQCLIFLFGLLVCTGFILMIMHLIGHLHIYMNSLKVVFAMGKATKQVDGTDSLYGIMNLIKLLYGQYKFSIIAATLFFSFILFVIPVVQIIRLKYPFTLVKYIFSKYLFLALIVVLIVIKYIDYVSIIYLLNGICLTMAIAIIILNKNKEISFLMYLGIFIAVVHPLGSSTGIETVIIYSLWIAFPIVFEYLFTLTLVGLNTKHSEKFGNPPSNLTLNQSQLSEVKKFSSGLLIFACLYYSFYYPYYDRKNRLNMHYEINNKFMKCIYTTKERATAINELLQESSKYVNPNDYVLAYDCMPLYHYLTDTKPYLRNPWPWLYQPDVFNDELLRSSAEIKIRPVIIFQIVRTLGINGSKWPDYSSNETTLNWNVSKSRNEILLEFIKKNHYSEVWSNKAFKIFIPAKSDLSIK